MVFSRRLNLLRIISSLMFQFILLFLTSLPSPYLFCFFSVFFFLLGAKSIHLSIRFTASPQIFTKAAQSLLELDGFVEENVVPEILYRCQIYCRFSVVKMTEPTIPLSKTKKCFWEPQHTKHHISPPQKQSPSKTRADQLSSCAVGTSARCLCVY